MPEKHRRRMLKTLPLVAVSAVCLRSVPDAWTRPVVKSVVLPVHAATTDSDGLPPPEATTTSRCIEYIDTPVGIIVIPCRNNPAR